MNRCALIAGVIMLLCCASAARGQEQRRVGLVATTGTGVGLVVHVSPRVSLRPEISFSTATVEPETPGASEVDTTTVSVAVSALFTIGRWDDLRAYVSPRFSFSRSTGTSVFSSGPFSSTFETTNTGYGFAGSFGAEYRLAARFAVFGETGLSFVRQKTESESTVSLGNSTARTFGTRSALGVVFYF